MEDKNELSDIILEEKEDNKMMKVKRILIIAALLTLIFLVILVVMKVLNKPESQEDTTKLVLPPEPQVKQVEPTEDDNLFKQVPIIEEDSKKESFEEMVKSLKEKEIKKQDENNQTAQANTQAEQESPQEVTQTQETAPKTTTENTQETKNNEQTAQKPTQPENTDATPGYYIQVAATTKASPDKNYLGEITKKNYTYRLLPIEVNGNKVTKILVGPYDSSAKANEALNGVKNSINKNAFLYRVK